MSDFPAEPIATTIEQYLGVKLELDEVQYSTFTAALVEGELLPGVQRETHPVALYQCTGGTTGRSKATSLTHSNLLAVLEMAGAYVNPYDIKIGSGEAILTALPRCSCGGFSFKYGGASFTEFTYLRELKS